MMPSDDDRTRDGRLLRWAVFATWMIVSAVSVWHHEPWRDEADTWLLARDASVSTVLEQAHSYGSPALWQLLLMLPAKAGAGIAAQQWLNWLFCAIAVWLVVVVLDLPTPVRVVAALSFQFAYEYAVVSRAYALGIALVLGAVALWRNRSGRAVLIALLLALATNTSVLAFILSACVALALVVDASTPVRQRAIAAAIFGAGALAAILQLYPPGEFVTWAPRAPIHVAMAGAVNPLKPTLLAGIAGCVAAAAVCFFVRRSRSALVFLLFALVAYGILFQKVYLGFPRHHGFLLVSMIVALALFAAERPVAELRIAGLVLALAFVPSGLDAARYTLLEYHRPFSGAVAAAKAIEARVPPGMPIAAHKPVAAESVLVQLDRRTFYYPALDRDGSYMTWDRNHWLGDQVTSVQAIEKAEAHFGAQRYALLLDRPLPAEYAGRFEVVAIEGRDVFSGTGEIYAVCIRK